MVRPASGGCKYQIHYDWIASLMHIARVMCIAYLRVVFEDMSDVLAVGILLLQSLRSLPLSNLVKGRRLCFTMETLKARLLTVQSRILQHHACYYLCNACL